MKKSLSMFLSLLLSFTIVFSTTIASADSDDTVEKAKISNNMREATQEEYLNVLKELDLKSEDVEQILIIEENEKNGSLEEEATIQPYSLLVKYEVGMKTRGTGARALRTYHLAPNAGFNYTQGFKVDRTLSADIGLSVSEVSAGLGYSKSVSSELTEQVSYTNDTNSTVEARIHPLIEYTQFTARNRFTNSLYGTATLGVPIGLAVVVVK